MGKHKKNQYYKERRRAHENAAMNAEASSMDTSLLDEMDDLSNLQNDVDIFHSNFDIAGNSFVKNGIVSYVNENRTMKYIVSACKDGNSYKIKPVSLLYPDVTIHFDFTFYHPFEDMPAGDSISFTSDKQYSDEQFKTIADSIFDELIEDLPLLVPMWDFICIHLHALEFQNLQQVVQMVNSSKGNAQTSMILTTKKILNHLSVFEEMSNVVKMYEAAFVPSGSGH